MNNAVPHCADVTILERVQHLGNGVRVCLMAFLPRCRKAFSLALFDELLILIEERILEA